MQNERRGKRIDEEGWGDNEVDLQGFAFDAIVKRQAVGGRAPKRLGDYDIY